MSPDPFRILGGILQTYIEGSLDILDRHSERFAEKNFGMSRQDVIDNFLKGGDPTMGVATRGIEPEEESIGIQGLASILAPGIPGGPIFRNADELAKALKKLPLEKVTEIAERAYGSAQEALRRYQNVFPPSQAPRHHRALGEGHIMPREFLEPQLVSDVATREMIQRNMHTLTDFPDVVDYSQINTDINQTDALLQLLDR